MVLHIFYIVNIFYYIDNNIIISILYVHTKGLLWNRLKHLMSL